MGSAFQVFNRAFSEAKTVPISGSADPQELVPAVKGRRPVVTYLWFTAGGATNLEFNSYNGSADTALSGTFAADTTDPNEWDGAERPILVGNARGDSIRTDNSGTASLQGFAVVYYVHV